MKKENLMDYLENKLAESSFADDLQVEWIKSHHQFLINFTLYAENKGQVLIEDVQGVNSAEEVITFEDAICLVDENKPLPDLADYLAVIPFDGKKGIKRRDLDAIVVYLEALLVDGQDQLFDFLAAEETTTNENFSLTWSMADFQKVQGSVEQELTFLPYPKY